MPRRRKPFAKIEPDFVLGRDGPGIEFASLDPRDQMIYLKWWARCIEARRIFWQETDEKLAELSRNLGETPTVFRRFLQRISGKNLVLRHPAKGFKLRGIEKLHAQLQFADGDKTVPERDPERGPDGGEPTPGNQKLDTRVTLPPVREASPACARPACAREEPPAGGPGGGDFSSVFRAFPALGRRGLSGEDVELALRGRNGKSAQALAALAAACEDESVRDPLALVRSGKGTPRSGGVERARAALQPARGPRECFCGGELVDANAPGAGRFGRRCAACENYYPVELL